MKNGNSTKNEPDEVDSIIIDQLKHGELGYLELERKVRAVQLKLKQKPCSHMTFHKHLKNLESLGQVRHNDAGKGKKGPYYLVKYDEKIERESEAIGRFTGLIDERFQLIKKYFAKLSFDEQGNTVTHVVSALVFQRMEIWLARLFLEDASFMADEESRITKIMNDVGHFVIKQDDLFLMMMLDATLASDVKKSLERLDKIIAPRADHNK